MKIKEIIDALEEFAPLSLQESYDNAGLITGNPNDKFKAAILTIDTIEQVVDEAIEKGANLIISHHPIVFSGIKKLNGKNYIERTIIKAIKNDIAIYAAHTNMDNVYSGVNAKICEKLALKNCKVLSAQKGVLKKLVTFVPLAHIDTVRKAVFDAGAGHIGNYDSCSYNLSGKGSFRALEGTKPFVGKQGKIHFEDEIRLETIFHKNKQSQIINALIESHPYEEVAYDIYPLDNVYEKNGAGMIGELEKPLSEKAFLNLIKKEFNISCIRHTELLNKDIKRVAVCGGSGSFLLSEAINQSADIFITGDFKYHQFFDAEKRIIIADIGHYESEQFTKELFYDILTKKFPTFAFYFSEINTNPVKYY
ncbi:MAG: Nif3-like dinuclear metal center hexameric protein [Bacteroidales bacterium]|nr:Nif3-like dinuclear metal center hexameric protein [Bacteroidales bacterium]